MEKRRSFIKKSGLLFAAGALPLGALAKVLGLMKSPPADVVITLYVDTARIDNQAVNASCNFGQDPSISNEEYTVDVNLGDTVTWQGVSANAPSTDVVNIVSINHEGGKNVFDQNILKGSGNPEKVTAIAKQRTDGGEKYKYKISFTVLNNGVKRNGTFNIDPKLAVH
ncbi:MAG TPA: hypothetical protein VIS49_13950 [Cyclobacteriaceae bacterium]